MVALAQKGCRSPPTPRAVGPGTQPGELGVYSNGGRLVVLIDIEELVKSRLDLKRAS